MGKPRLIQLDPSGAIASNVARYDGAKWAPAALVPGDITGFDAQVKTTIGGILLDTNTVNLTYSTTGPGSISADVITQLSITSDASGIKLVNDVATPGNNKIYGTDGSGVKGWYNSPSGADGNGIYSGDGIIGNNAFASVTNAKLPLEGVFRFDYNDDGFAMKITDLATEGSLDIELKTNNTRGYMYMYGVGTTSDAQIRIEVPNNANSFLSLRGATLISDNLGTAPDEKSVLEIKSTTKGFLLPRMSTAQFNTFSAGFGGVTQDGMILYETGVDK